MATHGTKHILIVDDDTSIVHVLQDALGLFRHDHAYTVETAADGVEGLAALERRQCDRRRGLTTPVLMLTGNEDNKSAESALASGIFAYVPKPFDLQQLEMLVSLAASSHSSVTAV